MPTGRWYFLIPVIRIMTVTGTVTSKNGNLWAKKSLFIKSSKPELFGIRLLLQLGDRPSPESYLWSGGTKYQTLGILNGSIVSILVVSNLFPIGASAILAP